MAAKTPKKFRQARKAAKVDAKKAFSGRKQAGLKDKSPLMKFSEDDKKALSEVREEARKGYITDDKGNKIRVKPTETSLERIARDRREAKAELERQWAIEDGKEKVRESKPANKPTPKITEAGKVRSAVTAPEPKSQGYKVDKDGKKIRPKGFKTVKTAGAAKKAAATESKKIATVEKKTLPVVKKGFAAGKELNAEGKAIYDRLIKEGVKPKSALNKALFRQEKGAKVAAKAAAPVAKAAKSAATAVKAQGPVKSKVPAGAKPIGVGTMKNGKLTFKFDDKQIKSIVEKNKAAKAGPAAVKAATTSAKKKFTAKGAALGAARLAGKAVTGKVGMAVTAAGLLAGPLTKQLTKDKNRITSADVMKGRELAAIRENAPKSTTKSRSNQPRITGQGRFVGVGAGGSTYKVNAGDTLSGIAKKAGVSLSELMAANKNIKDPKKIYRNTSVKIPSKGKLPAGGYTGPVPYRPKKK